MKYQLIKPTNPQYDALTQVLTNRGIPREEIEHYINTTDKDINSSLLLGEDKLNAAAGILIQIIQDNGECKVVVDADCDGFTSSALLINYLYDLFPTWVQEKLTWYIHSSKQHGLNDCYEQIEGEGPNLVILPDSSSNDAEYHEHLAQYDIKMLVLDHHEYDRNVKTPAIIINNQYNYPNPELSGAGVTWQFCRYLDFLLGKDYAERYLDLVALGNTADMMSLRSIETKHLINKGFEPDNIHNPFIYYMWQKNIFKLGDCITSWGAAFYIAPFVNAMVRSGTQEEKELLFNSMLKFKAFEMIPSNKRGHKLGEQERLVDQAIRTCTNVKNRQGRAQDAGMELVEKRIKDNHMMDNKVLLFLLEPGEIDRNIAGLVANKLMAKYQRPCCMLTKVDDDGNISYQGSARGCDAVDVSNFKDICEKTGYTMYEAGHQGAFGLGISADNINNFISATNEILKDMPSEPMYYVDYIYTKDTINAQQILDIAEMDKYWGKDVQVAYIAIEKLKITKDMVTLMSPDKAPTLKIALPNNVSIIKFSSSEEEYNKFAVDGYIEANIIGTCNRNEWNGNVSAQIMMEDYEFIDSSKYYF